MIRRAGRFCRRRQGSLEAAAVAAGHAAQALLPNSKAGSGGPATLQSPGTCVPEMHGMQSAGLPPHNVTQTHAHAHSTGLEVRGTLVARLPDVASRVVAFSGGVNSVCQCDRNFGQACKIRGDQICARRQSSPPTNIPAHVPSPFLHPFPCHYVCCCSWNRDRCSTPRWLRARDCVVVRCGRCARCHVTTRGSQCVCSHATPAFAIHARSWAVGRQGRHCDGRLQWYRARGVHPVCSVSRKVCSARLCTAVVAHGFVCSEDAKVVVADVNVEGGKAVADEINAAHGDDRAVFCEVNVKNVRGFECRQHCRRCRLTLVACRRVTAPPPSRLPRRSMAS